MDTRNITKIVRNMGLYKRKISKGKEDLNETEFEMIRYVTKREKRSFKEISDYLNVDKGLVTRMSKKLNKSGYLLIENDSIDKRKKYLIATPKAYLLKETNEINEYDFYDACLKVLSAEEKETFSNLLDKIYLESKRLRKTSFEGISKNEKEDNKI